LKVIRSAALALTAVSLLLATSARADVRQHSDPTGDVQFFVNSDPSDVPPPTAVPKRAHGDITVVRVANDTSTVRVVVSFRTLGRSGQFHGHVFRLLAGSFARNVQITAGPEEKSGWNGDAQMSTTSGKPVRCRAMTHQIDYPNDRVILRVPSSCLRYPASVRVGAGTVMLANERTYFDDGYKARGDMGMAALRPTLGPAVVR